MSLRYGLCLALLVGVSARAQQPQTANVKGRLHAAGETSFHGYVIELESLASHEGNGEADDSFKRAGEWNQIVVAIISDTQRTFPNRCRQIRDRWSGTSSANGKCRIL